MMRGKRLAAFLAVLAMGLATTAWAASDYYNYGAYNPGIGYTTGIAGYIDTQGYVEGVPGGEYLFLAGSQSDYGGQHYGYIYRVDTAGDPNLHPDNPQATGPISPRTFTQIGSPYYLGNYASGHDHAFYVNDTGIYYGPNASFGGVYHWDFGWTNKAQVAPPTPVTTQTLAYDEATGNWWAATAGRDVYMYNGTSWAYQGTHPNLSGDHHDGMEIVGSNLVISDMTSDVLIMYTLDGSIDWANPDETFTYSEPASVEGMGFGPNQHLWISGWNSFTFYEIGGGTLQQHLVVPEPVTVVSCGFGLLALLGYARKRTAAGR